MSTPGFTAATSLYKTSVSYFSPNASRSPGATVRDQPLFTTVLSDVAYLNPYHDLVGYQLCGALGQSCCRSPIQNLAAFGPLVSCNTGLGCDVVSGKCVSTCGGTGQACCDGPDTPALRWNADGSVYSPNYWNLFDSTGQPVTIRPMCKGGACDKQTHRCSACGTQAGAACCPPDASLALASCSRDA